ncbi:AAA family ATPase [Campylobacter sp. 19-13652]|uniref:cytidylate kinase-like family protein n=1 Tax=Campylobacter sp. 19-13652 TaxID=2840180 RepID=UPI001C747683|nr:cytidylate kinase-like family protein [Campylobacter sp. 19-13652]BCX79350.1 cytidylate kinase [Campylobacter sp. 19-13652]
MIISIGRQAGSGGLEIASKLATRLGVEFLGEEELIAKAATLGYFEQLYSFYKESPVSTLMQAIAINECAPNRQDEIFAMYSALANSGDFVIIGRCANYFLKGTQEFVSVFLHAPDEFKLSRLMNQQGFSQSEALEYMERTDRERASFHRYYTGQEWGGTPGYDLCINTAKTGIKNSVEIILDYAYKERV